MINVVFVSPSRHSNLCKQATVCDWTFPNLTKWTKICFFPPCITNLSFCAQPAWLFHMSPLQASWVLENALQSPWTSYTELWDSTVRPDPVQRPDNKDNTPHILCQFSEGVGPINDYVGKIQPVIVSVVMGFPACQSETGLLRCYINQEGNMYHNSSSLLMRTAAQNSQPSISANLHVT